MADLAKQARDEALDLLALYRSAAIAELHKVAVELAARNGSVSSPEAMQVFATSFVGAALLEQGLDLRFSGAVFRRERGWEACGMDNGGSHKRLVRRWKWVGHAA